MPSLDSTHRLLLFGVVALIVYGSLFPFNFDSSVAAERLRAALADRSLWTSKGDTLGNIGLFVPMGFAGFWAFRDRTTAWGAASIVITAGIALAVALQVLQTLLPTRSPAFADVISNAFGLCVGLGLAHAARRGRWLEGTAGASFQSVPAVLICLWCVSEMLPMVPALDWQQIKDNLKPVVFARTFDTANAILVLSDVVLLAALLLQMSWNKQRKMVVLTGLLAAVALGKVISIRSSLSLDSIAGFGAGAVVGWMVIGPFARIAVPTSVFASVAAITLAAFSPFDFTPYPSDVSWVPFQSFLQASMLDNVRSLLSSVFRFGAILFLIARRSGHVIGVGVALGAWIALIELAQRWVVGRSSDMTQPLLMIALAIGIRLVEGVPAPGRAVRNDRVRVPKPPPAAEPQPRPQASSAWTTALAPLAVTSVAIAVSLYALLRLPGIPYNVAELFFLDGAFPVLVVFAWAVLWPGIGARWAGHRLALSVRPLLTVPVLWFLVSMVSLLLLYLSVTNESLDDICGNNNLYWFVTHRDIWGEHARELFLWINSTDFIELFERPVRYAALFGPMAIVLMILFAVLERWGSKTLDVRWIAGVLAVAIPLLWLCKSIAFTWSSTDNLNELIAHPGLWGIRGGAFLWALMFLLSLNAVAVSRARTSRAMAIAVAASLALVPVGWWLLNAGLDPEVHKYDLVFSGAQFLLGPDRTMTLSPVSLFLRWSVLQLGYVFMIAFGATQADKLIQLGKTTSVGSVGELRQRRRRSTH